MKKWQIRHGLLLMEVAHSAWPHANGNVANSAWPLANGNVANSAWPLACNARAVLCCVCVRACVCVREREREIVCV